MGRHSKAHKAELLRAQAEAMLRKRNEETDDEMPAPEQTQSEQKKAKVGAKAKPKTKPKTKPKKARVEDETSGRQHGSANAHELRSGYNNNNPSPTKLTGMVENLAATLAAIGDPEDVKNFLSHEGLGAEDIKHLHQNCQNLKTSLQNLGKQSDTFTQRVPSTIEHYDKYMVYRSSSGPKMLYLLGVVEAFRPNHTAYSRRKVVGFVRTKGTTMPLQCALSGYFQQLEDHPRMLDTDFWLNEVKHWAEVLDHDFRVGPWDRQHGRDDGDGYASHVEPTLFLFYASHLVGKYIGTNGDIRKTLKSMWRLRLMDQKFEAEVFLSKPPCKQCEKFQKDIEDLTGIKFTYIIMNNLAEVFPAKDAIGYDKLPRFAGEEDKENFMQELEFFLENRDASKKGKSKIAIEVPQSSKQQKPQAQKPRTHETQQPTPQSEKHSNAQALVQASNEGIMSSQVTPTYSRVITTSKTIQKRKIQSFTYENPNTIVLPDDSDESEYEPPVPRSRTKTYSSYPNTPKNRSSMTGLHTPGSEPFSVEARKRAKELREKKRRANDVQESPSAAKKARWNGY
ncbi:uncharacterized protein PAC_06882 [Phialocephala subalpina]|uniref:Uncharacterized protein n=1 Tax=Phialocephala subalpina TaxID=576137 RepID=A0A1L7WW73_9HELO|nr:uncharacterized protein PAC_06882 [Phialocephala subalpina]